MTTSLISQHRQIVTDTCCMFNLIHSGYAESILNCFEPPLHIPVDAQSILVNSPIQSLVEKKSLYLTDLENDFEFSYYIAFSRFGLQNADAACAAIALNRNWAIATDDSRMQMILHNIALPVQIITTPDIIKYWIGIVRPSLEQAMAVIADIQRNAHYYPPMKHALYTWWQNYLKTI